jgi:glutamate racemase
VPDPRPIGVFDSGVGGLTVVRAMIDALPHEPVVYYGDTGRFPYGPRALEEIRGFAVQIAEHLQSQDVKLIVVACNAATAAALPDVTEAVSVPVVGVIEPAVRTAIRATRNGRVGLIGTVATIESGAYQRAFGRMGGSIETVARACPAFVEFVERGDTTSPALLSTALEYLAPLKAAGVDTLILGCTHYPLLRGAIHHVMGPEVLLLSSAEETANDVYEVLSTRDLLNDRPGPPGHRFETSGDANRFAELGRRFLGPEFGSALRVDLEPVGGP